MIGRRLPKKLLWVVVVGMFGGFCWYAGLDALLVDGDAVVGWLWVLAASMVSFACVWRLFKERP